MPTDSEESQAWPSPIIRTFEDYFFQLPPSDEWRRRIEDEIILEAEIEEERERIRMDPPAADTSAAAVDAAVAAAAVATGNTICACGANLINLSVNANICRCVPLAVRELFQNQRVPNLVLFNTEWVHYFGHEYQNTVEVPEWLVIRATELSPAVVWRRSRTERAAREWARLEESYNLLRGPSFSRAELAEWTRGGLELRLD